MPQSPWVGAGSAFRQLSPMSAVSCWMHSPGIALPLVWLSLGRRWDDVEMLNAATNNAHQISAEVETCAYVHILGSQFCLPRTAQINIGVRTESSPRISSKVGINHSASSV